MTIEDFIFQMKPQPWREQATCQVEGADPDLFILSQGQSASEAKTYCIRCPVARDCLEYGIATGSVGVWGGKVLSYRNPHPTFTEIQDGRPQKITAPKRRRNQPTAGRPPSIAARKRI